MGNIRLYGSTSGYTELAPPAVAPDGVLSLPSGTGTIAKTTDQGLVLISPTSIANSGGTATASGGAVTFTGVNSISLNGVFTSTYDNYAILFSNTTISASGYFLCRLRVSGTDNSSSNYRWSQVNGSSAGTASASGNAADTSFKICYWNGGGYNSLNNFQINSPNLVSGTSFSTTSMETGATVFNSTASGAFNATTQFDGLTVFPATGTTTGIIRVYGYKNS